MATLELRARVEAILKANNTAPAPSQFRAPQTPGDGEATEFYFDAISKIGQIVAGRYKLLQQIGEGGMGTVWMADQTEPVKRRVAVKLIRVERGNRRRSCRGSRRSVKPSR